MHRISYEKDIKKMLLEKDGLLITGWSNISDDAFLHEIAGKGRSEFDKIYEKHCKSLPRNRFCLYMFLSEFQEGDYVVVPSTGTFSVYEIVSDKPFSQAHLTEFVNSEEGKDAIECKDGKCYKKGTADELDLGFFWQVKPVETDISREQFAANNLQKRMKYQMTNINMTDLQAEIEEAIRLKRDNKPVVLRNEIVDATCNIVVDKLKSTINDAGFEKVVQWYLKRLGADTALIPSKNALSKADGDVDVIGVFEDLGITVFVQAKQYDQFVDKGAIEQLVNAYESVYKGTYPGTAVLWVVTTCDQFTQDAIDYASENYVECISGSEFAKKLLDAGLKNLTL